MNVRTRLVGRLPGRLRVIDDVSGFVDDVWRLRRVGFRRLLDHDDYCVQKT
jgi:hypothetical protein